VDRTDTGVTVLANGNAINGTSLFTYNDGTTGEMADVIFLTSNLNT
jgi:hypothetical protein